MGKEIHMRVHHGNDEEPEADRHHTGSEAGVGRQVVSRSEAEVEWLRRFVPSVVREAVSKDPLHPPLCPKCRQMRDLSVFFMDIAGFTRLCESLPPWRMQELIEAYFSSPT